MLQQYQKTDILLRTAPNLVWVEKFSPSVGANRSKQKGKHNPPYSTVQTAQSASKF